MTAIARPALVPGEGLWSRIDDRSRVGIICVVAAGVGMIGAQGGTLARALVGGFGLLVFVLIAFSGRDTALSLVVVWLALLGFVRRLLIPFAGWSAQDPLLLVSPAAAVTLWFTARREAPPATLLSGAAAFMLMWSGAQVFNPAEASILTGLQGTLFYFTPLMWFFVGRTMGGRQHDRLLTTVLAVNVVVVGHGLYQSFVGLLPFELTWIGVSGQSPALFLAGFQVRPFSTLVSPQEYAYFLMFATLILWSRLLHLSSSIGPHGTGSPATGTHGSGLARRRWLVAGLLATLVALFFTGGRGTMVFVTLGIAVTTVARRRSPQALLVIAALVVGLAMFVTQQDVQSGFESDVEAQAQSKASVIVTHQLTGLTNPSNSTAPLHLAQAMRGFEDALEYPLGLGASEATIASLKAEGDKGPTPENDLGNTMLALGLPGGIALMVLIGAGLTGAVRMYRQVPNARHLAWLGIFVAALFQWMNGAMYSVSALLFLSLGGLDRQLWELRRNRPRLTGLPPGGRR